MFLFAISTIAPNQQKAVARICSHHPRVFLRAHDQGYGGRRLMTQCARRARHSNGIGAGLRALLLPAASATTSATPTSAAVASCCSTRWEQEREQQQEQERPLTFGQKRPHTRSTHFISLRISLLFLAMFFISFPITS